MVMAGLCHFPFRTWANFPTANLKGGDKITILIRLIAAVLLTKARASSDFNHNEQLLGAV